MARYNPDIIQQYADSLYRKADQEAAGRAVALGLAGLAMAFVLRTVGVGNDLLTLILTGGGAAAGWQIGQAKAFQFRLQAQQALCQLQIEINTRPGRAESERTEEQYQPNWGRQPQV